MSASARPEVSAPPPRPRRFSLNPFHYWHAEGELTAVEMAEGGLLADLGVLIDLASIYIPLVGGVIAVAAPTPFVLLMLRRGWRATVLATLVAAFLVTVIAGPHFGWRMAVQALVGLVIGWAMRRKTNPLVVIFSAAVLIALSLFLATILLIFLAGLPVHDVVQELRNGFNSLAAGLAGAAQIVGAPTAWRSIQPSYAAFAAFAVAYWPLLLFILYYGAAVATAAVYYFVADGAMRVLGYDIPPFPPHWVERPLRRVLMRFDAGGEQRADNSHGQDESSARKHER